MQPFVGTGNDAPARQSFDKVFHGGGCYEDIVWIEAGLLDLLYALDINIQDTDLACPLDFTDSIITAEERE